MSLYHLFMCKYKSVLYMKHRITKKQKLQKRKTHKRILNRRKTCKGRFYKSNRITKKRGGGEGTPPTKPSGFSFGTLKSMSMPNIPMSSFTNAVASLQNANTDVESISPNDKTPNQGTSILNNMPTMPTMPSITNPFGKKAKEPEYKALPKPESIKDNVDKVTEAITSIESEESTLEILKPHWLKMNELNVAIDEALSKTDLPRVSGIEPIPFTMNIEPILKEIEETVKEKPKNKMDSLKQLIVIESLMIELHDQFIWYLRVASTLDTKKQIMEKVSESIETIFEDESYSEGGGEPTEPSESSEPTEPTEGKEGEPTNDSLFQDASLEKLSESIKNWKDTKPILESMLNQWKLLNALNISINTVIEGQKPDTPSIQIAELSKKLNEELEKLSGMEKSTPEEALPQIELVQFLFLVLYYRMCWRLRIASIGDDGSLLRAVSESPEFASFMEGKSIATATATAPAPATASVAEPEKESSEEPAPKSTSSLFGKMSNPLANVKMPSFGFGFGKKKDISEDFTNIETAPNPA